MTLKGILLDKDGTLIDFDATWGPAAYEMMRTLAEGDEGRLAALIEVSHYVLDGRRFLPSSPLLAGSSASYGPLWARALGRPAGRELYAEMDELFRFWGLESLSPIGRPAEIAAALVAEGYRLGHRDQRRRSVRAGPGRGARAHAAPRLCRGLRFRLRREAGARHGARLRRGVRRRAGRGRGGR